MKRTQAGFTMIELIVVIAVAYGLWTLRHQTLDAELRVAASLSAAMAEQAEGTLDVANAVLHATQAELTEGLLVPEAETANAWLGASLHDVVNRTLAPLATNDSGAQRFTFGDCALDLESHVLTRAGKELATLIKFFRKYQ